MIYLVGGLVILFGLALAMVYVLMHKNLELTNKLVNLALSKNVVEYKEAEKVSSILDEDQTPPSEFVAVDDLSDAQFESLVVKGEPLNG